MRLIRILIGLSGGTTILALGAGLALADRWMYPLLIPMVIFWVLTVRFKWSWGSSLIFAGYFVFVIAAFLRGGQTAWLMVGILAALTGWDLLDFLWRLEDAGRIEHEDKIVTQHLTRLAVVAVTGSFLAIFAVQFQIRLDFGWVLGLVLLAILMIRWGLVLSRRRVG